MLRRVKSEERDGVTLAFRYIRLCRRFFLELSPGNLINNLTVRFRPYLNAHTTQEFQWIGAPLYLNGGIRHVIVSLSLSLASSPPVQHGPHAGAQHPGSIQGRAILTRVARP